MASSNSFFRGLPSCVHLIHNLALFLAFCFCSFLLHVVAIFIYIFLDSCHSVELSAIKKLISFVVKKCLFYCSSEKLHLHYVSCYLFICVRVQISIPYRSWVQPLHYLLIFENLWTKVCLKLLFKIPFVSEHFDSICWYSFHFHSTIHTWNI